MLRKYLIDFSSTSHRHLIDFSSTSHRLLIDMASTSHRHGIDVKLIDWMADWANWPDWANWLIDRSTVLFVSKRKPDTLQNLTQSDTLFKTYPNLPHFQNLPQSTPFTKPTPIYPNFKIYPILQIERSHVMMSFCATPTLPLSRVWSQTIPLTNFSPASNEDVACVVR